ncbi:alpha/beta fold hydrolase [Cytobacillus kochii]|uniref:alpha/beta fold hydrolase n=1 Tax=Cytobacillus kochii TaxID=859143 RepID=UPI00402AF8B7
MWKRKMLQTQRGAFEIFQKGVGKPLCVAHLYAVFNETGDYFAHTFSERFCVTLINLRGVGESEQAHQPYEYSMVDSVLDIEAIRVALGYERWIYAGHSTGGMIGLLYALLHQSSLESLVIVGSAARDYTESSACIYNEKHPKFAEMQQYQFALTQPNITAIDKEQLKKKRIQLSLFEPEKYTQYFTGNICKDMSGARLNFFSREAVLFDITRKLKHINIPTSICCGRYDVQCPVEYSKEIHQEIPQSQLFIFEKSNHYPFLEEKDLFQKVIDQALN